MHAPSESGGQLVPDAVATFVEAEVAPLGLPRTVDLDTGQAVVHVAGIGTTAPRAVNGTLLAGAIESAGWQVASTAAFASPAELVVDGTWTLALALSPWKRDVGTYCDVVSPSAELTGVIDTVIRTPSGTVGFNTNVLAAAAALDVSLGGLTPRRVIILGSGASARSVVLAIQRTWPGCSIEIAARSPASAGELAASMQVNVYNGARSDVPPASPAGPGLVVVNATTWGETEASEAVPLGIDPDTLLAPGVRLFDLNNRIGTLARLALEAGCVVISGAIMQRVAHASRAALLPYMTDGGGSRNDERGSA